MDESDKEGNLSYNEYLVSLTPNVRLSFVFEKISSRSNFYSMRINFKSDIINTSVLLQDPVDSTILDRLISTLINARHRIHRGD